MQSVQAPPTVTSMRPENHSPSREVQGDDTSPAGGVTQGRGKDGVQGTGEARGSRLLGEGDPSSPGQAPQKGRQLGAWDAHEERSELNSDNCTGNEAKGEGA